MQCGGSSPVWQVMLLRVQLTQGAPMNPQALLLG
jgi:hypothetical protein